VDPCGRQSRSSLALLFVGNERGNALDADAPQLFLLIEQPAREAQPLEIGVDNLAAPDALFGHQASTLEDGDVLLNGREAHRVVAGEFDDPFLGSDRATDDVTAGMVGESAEHAIEVGRCNLH